MVENKHEQVISEKIAQIAARIKEMRLITAIEAEDIAKQIGIDIEKYLRYENAQDDIPISIIYKAALILGVDSTVLITGEDARMPDYTIVRAGKGENIQRYPGYDFSSLALNFIARKMDPMIVSLKTDDNPVKLVSHEGQEFNYVIDGEIIITIGNHEFNLKQGDSIYFDPKIPHGQRAKDTPSRFLTVICD